MKSKGFTLVEVLAVLIILSALFAIAVPGVVKNYNNMKKAGSKAEKSLIESAAYNYYQSHVEEMNISNHSCYLKIDVIKDLIEPDMYETYKDYNIVFQTINKKKTNPIVTVTKSSTSGIRLCTN